jgi:DNA repair protein RadC
VLAAGPVAQRRVLGNERQALAFLGTIRVAMLHALRAEALSGPVLGNSKAVINYLFASMAHEPAEQLRVLYLNAKNRLLRDETVLEGSINVAPIYPREIMRRSLEVGATALIIAHNHPSGDPRPSSDDIRVTRLVSAAAAALDIRLHDHVIVARSGWTSFSASGLL